MSNFPWSGKLSPAGQAPQAKDAKIVSPNAPIGVAVNYDDKRLGNIVRTAKMVPVKQALAQVYRPAVSAVTYVPTLAALLRTCPTAEDIDRVMRLPIHIQDSLLSRPAWRCTEGGSEASVELRIINEFRIMAAMRFDSPIPLLGTMTVYDYVLQMIANGTLRSISYVRDTGDGVAGYAVKAEGLIVLGVSSFEEPFSRSAFTPRAGWSPAYTGLLYAHEIRHLQGYDHDVCGDRRSGGNTDRSLGYDGAFASGYWLWTWMADHSGEFLPPAARNYIRESLPYTRHERFCDG